jgi:hypothetical protein
MLPLGFREHKDAPLIETPGDSNAGTKDLLMELFLVSTKTFGEASTPQQQIFFIVEWLTSSGVHVAAVYGCKRQQMVHADLLKT